MFNLNPYKIDTGKFSNILHDKIIQQVEKSFAEYVGAKYAVLVSTATSGIFLSLKYLNYHGNYHLVCKIPSLITTRFISVISHSGNKYIYTDDVDWVGGSYVLYEDAHLKIVDSAQRVEPMQFENECNDNDILVFSNYPTKPIGGISGGVVVSNDKDKIDWIRQAAYFGENFSSNSWEGESAFKGWQMHNNSVSAYIINENFKKYNDKRSVLDMVRELYHEQLPKNVIVTGDSYHLFRIRVGDNKAFINFMKENGVVCGIHYKPAHLEEAYKNTCEGEMSKSEKDGREVASLPFNEKLEGSHIYRVCELIKMYENEENEIR